MFICKSGFKKVTFRHKLDALKFMYEHDKTAELEVVYHPEVFDNIDWTKEPEESWEQLLDQYVIQCRLKYPKLALLWSGGSDSHTLYLAFKRNKIHLDYIIVLYSDDLKKGFSPEVIDWLTKNHYDKTTQIIRHRRDIQKDNIEVVDYIFSIINEKAPSLSLPQCNILSTAWFQYCVDDNVTVLMGIEKPIIIKKDNIWYHRFNDIIVMNRGDAKLAYIDPSFPKLAVKQAHILKRNIDRFIKPVGDWSSAYYINSSINYKHSMLVSNLSGRHPGISLNNAMYQHLGYTLVTDISKFNDCSNYIINQCKQNQFLKNSIEMIESYPLLYKGYFTQANKL